MQKKGTASSLVDTEGIYKSKNFDETARLSKRRKERIQEVTEKLHGTVDG